MRVPTEDTANKSGRSIHRLLPVQDEESWREYCKQRDSFWVAAELDLSRDAQDFMELSESERRVITHVLAFFASSDSVVSEALVLDLYDQAPTQEARMFYTMQLAIESIHTETYNLLIDTLVPDHAEKDALFSALTGMPCVKKKADWYAEALSDASFAVKLWVQAIVEGVFFSASFAFIFWIKQRKPGQFGGLTLSNQFIARDEGLHRDFSVMLLRRVRDQLPQTQAHSLLREAVERECDFIDDAFNGEGLLGMSQVTMKQYVRFVADHLCKSVGYDALFEAPNPYDWMEGLSLEGKTNFFESRVSEYSKVQQRVDTELTFDADF